MKRTPLHEEHIKRNAKMIEFGGWEMPVYYSGIIDEVMMVRRKAGLFDVSHMAEIEIEGKDSDEFVNYLITNDFSSLNVGDICYTVMCNEEGGIIDDLLAYRMDNKALLVVNAANEGKDYTWISEKAKDFNVNVKNISSEKALLALQGPDAESILEEFVDIDLRNLKYYSFTFGSFHKDFDVLISRTGYTGEDGFEIMSDWKDGVNIWNSILNIGKDRIKPCGLGARDVLRLEAGYLLYGNDMDETTDPFEVGLKWVVKFNKADFIGRKALEHKRERIERRLRGFVLLEKGIPRHGDEVVFDGERIGTVTSGTHSPTLNKGIGMCLLNVKYSNFSEKLVIRSKRGRELKIELTRLPFYRGSVKKRK